VKILKLFEERFWLPIGTSLILGLLLPGLGKHLGYLIIPMFMLIFFLTCLKIDFIDVIKHIKKPFFISYILIFYLIIIPAVLYFIFRIFNTEYAIGILLLTAIPPGTVSPVFTDIAKGNTTLSMAIALCCYLVSPFTITFLFFILTRTTIHLDLLKLFYTLLLVNFLPLILAQIVRKTRFTYIEKTKKYYSFVTIVAIAFVIYIVIATQQSEIVQNPIPAVIQTLGLYVLFFYIVYTGIFYII